MPTPEIIDSVRQLRADLAGTPPAAAETEHITSHLDSVLEDPTHASRYDGLSARLRSAVEGLESRHPQLAASMNTVINALNTAGI